MVRSAVVVGTLLLLLLLLPSSTTATRRTMSHNIITTTVTMISAMRSSLRFVHAKEYKYEPGVDMAEAQHAPLLQALAYHNLLHNALLPQLGHLRKYDWLHDYERIQLDYDEDVDEEGPVPCLHLRLRSDCELVVKREIIYPVPIDKLHDQTLMNQYGLAKARQLWDLARQDRLDEQTERAVQEYEASVAQDPHNALPPPRIAGGVARRERQVLHVIYDALEGTQIMRVPGHWKSRVVDHCEWSGIVCEAVVFSKDECALAVQTDPDRLDDDDDDVDASSNKEYKSCKISVVTRLELPSQKLTGTIPSELARLSHLQVLYLNHNYIHGSLPTEMAKMTQLEQVYCNHNALTGTLPALPHAKYIACAHNFLDGGIGALFRSAPGLRWLDVSHNALAGSVPAKLWQSPTTSELQYLFLSDNALTGSLPSPLGTWWTDLRTLDLQNNRLTGTLPRLPRTLMDLNLSHNQFTIVPNNHNNKEFPSQLLQLSRLQTLILSHNSLAGSTLPKRWSALSTLGILKLDHNQLVGSIPETWYTAAEYLRE